MALTARVDPIRNFKFNVQASTGDSADPFADFGFMSVEGIAMNTEMVAYREGGMNTSPHKLPGQTDFSPLTMSTGVYYNKPQLWTLARKMFSVQHGGGSLGMNGGEITEFRYTLVVRVLGHPVTAGTGVGHRSRCRSHPGLQVRQLLDRLGGLLGAQRLGQRHRGAADDGPPRGLRRLLRQCRRRQRAGACAYRLTIANYQGALIVTDVIPTPAGVADDE